MPEGPLGFRRLTSIGPLTNKTDEEEWKQLQEEADKKVEELGL